MTWAIIRRATASVLLISGAGCNLLDVSDPTAIKDSDVQNAFGADLLRRDAVRKLYVAIAEGIMATGVLSDELFTLSIHSGLDQRIPSATTGTAAYTLWSEVRRAATVAIPELSTYTPEVTRREYVGEMYAVRGYATLGLVEGFCAGFPLHEIVAFKPIFGNPLSSDDGFERALADFDTALTFASDSARILNLVRIGRARTLLGRGRFPEAAQAVAEIPTGYAWSAEYFETGSTQINGLARQWRNNSFISVGNREGGNGLDFVAANDPRLRVRFMMTVLGASYYAANKYPNQGAPIVIASGIEARLIEAEAALRSGDANWLAILNDLRATQIIPGMEPLADPGTESTRVDLLFRERAFWLYGTGHRLGDLRRLMRHYGRPSESVFPTGTFYLGGFTALGPRGVYGPGTSIPFPTELEAPYNQAITGCTSP